MCVYTCTYTYIYTQIYIHYLQRLIRHRSEAIHSVVIHTLRRREWEAGRRAGQIPRGGRRQMPQGGRWRRCPLWYWWLGRGGW